MRHRGIGKTKQLGAFLLAALMAVQTPAAVLAETGTEVVSEQIISIRDVHDFLNFVDNCSFDTWSQGKTVRLEKDLSLAGIDFLPVPTFGGTFDGQGHSISDIKIDAKFSQTGLFSVIQESGVVCNLNVSGEYMEESSDHVGGIAGENRGTIENCSFRGTIKGSSEIGGIAGKNEANGKVRDCAAEGSIAGKSMTGGIVGNNLGVISACRNMSGINLESADPGVNLEKLGVDSDTNFFSIGNLDTINVATDTGGIAGFSSGMILSCINMGTVGYPQIGYNVGGIAGRSSGYITACENNSEIFGRKDVGGIVGQAEPYIELKLSEKLFQDFHDQLDILSNMVDKAADEAQASSKRISETLNEMGDSVGAAADTTKELTDSLVDFGDDTIQEIDRAGDVLSDALSMLSDSLYYADNIGDNLASGFRNLESAMEHSKIDRSVIAEVQNAEAQCEEISGALTQIKDGMQQLQGMETIDWSRLQAVIAQIQEAFRKLQESSTVLKGLMEKIDQMIKDLNEVSEDIKTKFSKVQNAMGDFADASDSLSDTMEDFYDITEYLEEADSIQIHAPEDLRNMTDDLYDQMKAAGDSADELEKNMSGMTDDLADNIRDINSQLKTAFQSFTDTLYRIEDGEDELISDTSQEDIDKVMNGKLRGCKNYGAVSGSTAVGGVAGTMSIEYELDPEDDLVSDSSLIRRREYELKAILQKCSNEGSVTARGNYVGSICGEMRFGLITDCEGYGDIASDSGKYVGGIAGHSSGTIQNCYAKCMLSGDSIVGGIVGSAGDSRLNEDGGKVSGCYSLAQIVACGECGGAIAGRAGGEFSDNYFVSKKLAGIDRVSLAGKAEPITYEQMMEISEIPNKFRWFTLRFFAENYMLKSVLFDYGASFGSDIYPEVPEKEGHYFAWDRTELRELHFDTDVKASYIPYHWSLASAQRREDGRTAIFVEGKFENDAVADIIEKKDLTGAEQLGTAGNVLEKREVLEVWKAAVPEDGNEVRNIRYLPNEECLTKGISTAGKLKRLELYQNTGSGWKKLDASEIGSYAAAKMSGSSAEIAVVLVTVRWWIGLIAAVLFAAAGGFLVFRKRKGKKAA